MFVFYVGRVLYAHVFSVLSINLWGLDAAFRPSFEHLRSFQSVIFEYPLVFCCCFFGGGRSKISQ